MKSAIAANPYHIEWKPRRMFSAPSEGPTVRSSMISIGAASAPGAQQQRHVVRLLRGHAAADLDAPAADLGADHGRGHHLALALLEQQDRHALAHVLARDLLEDARAGAVQADVHRRLAGLVVEARLRVVDAVAGQDDLLLHEERLRRRARCRARC